MKDVNLYFPLWKRFLPIILIQMKNSGSGMKEIKMVKDDFEVYGNRPASDYVFNLEIENGKVVNDISHTAVARDLFSILSSDKSCSELMKNRHFKLSLGKEFILRIHQLSK